MKFPSGANDIPDVRVPGTPAKALLEPVGVRDQLRRISGAPRSDCIRYLLADNLFNRVHHFLNRLSDTRAGVELVGTTTAQQGFYGQDMRLSQVTDMDVVANAGAIFRIVVVAMDGQR